MSAHQLPTQIASGNALRLQRGATHLHGLGPRAVGELLAEIGKAHRCEADILARLAAYSWMTPHLLEMLGGRTFPPRLRAVPSAEVGA